MSFTCELSGEPLQVIDGSIVVTPSGHICQRRLILQKLESNGGKDPFENEDRPLTEDDLVELKVPKIMPPRSNDSSVQVTLQHLQQDYDAVLLELFDTRKLLAETREELSQALYQNDAAVRVVARMAAERDQARAALNDFQLGGGSSAIGTNSTLKRSAVTEEDGSGAPSTKKVKTVNVPSTLPEEDHKTVVDTWEALHPQRKSLNKKAATAAPTPSQISQATSIAVALDGVTKEMGTESILASNGSEAYCQVVGDQLYEITKGEAKMDSKVICTLSKNTPTALSSLSGEASNVVVGFRDGSVDCVVNGTIQSSLPTVDGSPIVSLSHHPDSVHIVATTTNGHVAIGNTKSWLAAFHGKTTYTCGALHPDGLLYLAGRSDGSMDLWDIKSQSLAATLPNAEGGLVHDIAFSSNGYHVAVAYGTNEVLVWDLRKQSILATLNTNASEALTMVRSLSFDEAGKYLVYSGVKGNKVELCVATVKQWNTTYTLQCGSATSVAKGLAWNKTGIAAAVSDAEVASCVFFDVATKAKGKM